MNEPEAIQRRHSGTQILTFLSTHEFRVFGGDEARHYGLQEATVRRVLLNGSSQSVHDATRCNTRCNAFQVSFTV